ncbi:MAG: C/D box methylation guide ribonucleoprotein complex aNOP56 subunit [Candidatus Altiarchaeota archaeon]
MHLVTNVLGSFVIKNGNIILQALFPQDAIQVAERLRKTERSFCLEEAKLIRELVATGNRKVEVNNPPRFSGSGLNMAFVNEAERISVYKIATDLYLDRRDVDSMVRKVNRLLVRERMKEVDKDQILMQAVDSLNDIDEAVNRLVERLREWYSLHFPELDYMVAAHDTYARLVAEVGERGNFASAKLNFEPKLTDRIIKSTGDSMGVAFDEKDIKAVQTLAKPILHLYQTQKEVEDYIGELMQDVAPNISALAGAVLGARLISLAHGLQRLATLPAGTIQLLGAEDAFFRFLKTGKKPPKHGIIFQLPAIRGASRNTRGKISRTFAAKLAIAAKVDAFKGQFIGDKLKADLEKRIASLK